MLDYFRSRGWRNTYIEVGINKLVIQIRIFRRTLVSSARKFILDDAENTIVEVEIYLLVIRIRVFSGTLVSSLRTWKQLSWVEPFSIGLQG